MFSKILLLWKKDVKTQTIAELETSVKKGSKDAKKELARRLIDGKEVKKNDARAASLLKECVIDGEAEAMLMLAKCYAFGIGVPQNGMQAEELVSESAKMGNKEALFLMELLNDWNLRGRKLHPGHGNHPVPRRRLKEGGTVAAGIVIRQSHNLQSR